MTGLSGQYLPPATADRRDPYRAQLLVVEGGVDDKTRIRRETRVELPVLVLVGQPFALIGLQVMNPDVAQRLVNGESAIRTGLIPAQHADPNLVRCDRGDLAQGRLYVARGPHLERYFSLAAIEPDPVQLALAPQHDAAAVGQPGKTGIVAAIAAGFLHVARDFVTQRGLDA